jgi:hypothetical protein
MEGNQVVDAHSQVVSHSYTINYPSHPARQDDPHYVDFEAYRRSHIATARCAVGAHRGDFSECSSGDTNKGLELHHAHVEFALQNGIDLKWLAKDYPGIDDPEHVGAWVESGQNLIFLCEKHHRGHGGVHVATASDYEAERYVRELIS